MFLSRSHARSPYLKALAVPGVVPCSGDKPFTVSGVFQFTPFSSVGLSGEP